MARTKDEQLHSRRRLQILEAAATVFRAKGFHAARTEEICAAAGLSAGTVFRYFRSKEDIIATIAEAEYEQYVALVDSIFTPEGLESVANIDADGLRDLLESNGYGLGPDSWLELYRNPLYSKRFIAEDNAILNRIVHALDEGQRKGWVKPDLEVSGVAYVLFSLFTGIHVDHQTNPELDLNAAASGLRALMRSFVLNN